MLMDALRAMVNNPFQRNFLWEKKKKKCFDSFFHFP